MNRETLAGVTPAELDELEGYLRDERGAECDLVLPHAQAVRVLAAVRRELEEKASPTLARAASSKPDEWRPISTLPQMLPRGPGMHITVRFTHSFRWQPYKPGAKLQHVTGRWQRATEYGWENARLPDGGDWRPAGEGAP